MNTRSTKTVLTIISLLFFTSFVHAHNRSQSFSDWTITKDKIAVIFTAKSREITRLKDNYKASLDSIYLDHLTKTVKVTQGNINCPSTVPATSLPSHSGTLRIGLEFRCDPQLDNINIYVNSFFQVATSHVHYANIKIDGVQSYQHLFTSQQPQHSVNASSTTQPNGLSTLTQYVVLGIEHIFGGIDHIAFLIALLLLLRQLRELAWMVAGFTVGHSLTLGMATLGWIIPDLLVTEAAIGFTIAAVAAENVAITTGRYQQIALVSAIGLLLIMLIKLIWGAGLAPTSIFGLTLFTLAYLWKSPNTKDSQRLKLLIIIAFGLIHGFGFAGALTDTGLSNTAVVWALIGFNLGIEIGQIFIIATVWVVLQWLLIKQYVQSVRLIVDILSALLCALGLYWFIVRSYAII
ncbi:MAG: HupE/UreJ family protein [Porticoccaceae bacterium]|nr:HupE/UreJ family protein [Porticoccaceae bacterium]